MAEDTCSVEGCSRPRWGLGMCTMHYLRVRRARGIPCAVGGCEKKAAQGTLCPMHYYRKRLHGSFDDPRPTLEQRFWSKVDRSAEEGCWPWTRSTNRAGYGQIMRGGRPHLSHRIAWVLTNGEIPDGLHVCHHCDNPPCCYPPHLFLGADADNCADMWAKGRAAIGFKLPHTKLSDEDVLAIRRLYRLGATKESLANQFDITPRYVVILQTKRLRGGVL